MSTNKRVKKPSPDLAGLHQPLSKDELAKRLELARQDNLSDRLLNKKELAKKLGLRPRGVECLLARRAIPVIRLSRRCVRFSWDAVKAALARLEVREIGR